MELECPLSVSSLASRSRLRLVLRSISSRISESVSDESRMLRLMLMAFDIELRAVSPALAKKELMADVEGSGVGCEPVLGDMVIRRQISWRKANYTCVQFLLEK